MKNEKINGDEFTNRVNNLTDNQFGRLLNLLVKMEKEPKPITSVNIGDYFEGSDPNEYTSPVVTLRYWTNVFLDDSNKQIWFLTGLNGNYLIPYSTSLMTQKEVIKFLNDNKYVLKGNVKCTVELMAVKN